MSDTQDEIVEVSWINELSEFKENVWPAFERAGFTIGEAYQTYTVNMLKNSVIDLIDEIRELKI